MKKTLLKLNYLIAVMFLGCTVLSAQEIILDPSGLEPHDDGYYVAGVWVDENNDGVDEFHNGCEDYYEDEDVSDGYNPDLNHKESGDQQGFTYHNTMIMPTCDSKSEPIDPPVATGYIQLHACLNSNTDSAIYSYIVSPEVINLESIYMETSSDVSIQDHRQIPYNIEYSKDGGQTWEATYLGDNVAAQGGYRVTYDGSVYLEIQEMIDASKAGPIVLRFITNDRNVPGTQQGQYVKIHSLKLTAEEYTGGTSTSKLLSDGLSFTIDNRVLTSDNATLEVYNIMGQSVGKGNQVELTAAGIYIVKSSNGTINKILVR